MIELPWIGRRASRRCPRSIAFPGWRRRLLAGLLVASVLASGVGPGSRPARAAGPFGWAYLSANQPTPPTGTYTPTRGFQFNSTGGTNSDRAINTVARTGVGAYTAMLPNLGAAAGTVHVTAFGSLIAGDDTSGPGSCQVANWRPDGTTQRVNVRCFSLTGAPMDGAFTLTYANLRGSQQPAAYLWANRPVTESYTPSRAYQFNSSGRPNTVTRTGVGAYTARLPNIGTDETAHVQVTAYGPGYGRCQVASWGPSGAAQQVKVRCFDSAGAPANKQFTLTYVSGTSVVGSPWRSGGSGTASAYVFAHRPTLASYTPRSFYRFNSSGETNTITRSGRGAYRVNFPGQAPDRGTLLVSTFGSESAQCKVASWTRADGVQVRCFDPSGDRVDAAFTATVLASTGLRQRLAVPSYFYPGPNDPEWDLLEDGAPTVGIAIINPNNGPVTSANPDILADYRAQVRDSKQAGLTVLGYVSSDYARRDVEDVLREIDTYFDLYSTDGLGVDGIFVDEAFSEDCTSETDFQFDGPLTVKDYYQRIYDDVEDRPGTGTVVINPGRRTEECYMSAADIVVNFESYWVAPPPIPPATVPFPSYATGTANSWGLPATAWEWKYPAERFWHIVHSATTQSDMQNAIRLAKQRNAGWVYITDDVLTDDPATPGVECDTSPDTPIENCNPWDELPPSSYWTIEKARAGLL